MVTANKIGSTGSISILLGIGDGSFMAAKTSDLGEGPTSVALGYINDDNALDAVLANVDVNDVSILLGTGDSSFLDTATFRVGTRPRSVALGYVDGDDVLDVVTANEGSNDVSILLGRGDGIFFSEQRFPVGLMPESVALAAVQDAPFDVNDDGFSDIITVNSVSESVSILRSTLALKNIQPTVTYERATIGGRDELIFYLKLPDEVAIPLGPNRTFMVRAFLPNAPEPNFIGRTTQTILSLDIPIVVDLFPVSSSE